MAPLKDPVAYVDCFCNKEPEGLCDSEHAFPKRPTESDKDSNPAGRRPFCGAIQYRRLIRSAPAKSLIRHIDLLELLLRFLLKPDVIRESIGMPYFRLITVCLSYLFERRLRLNLKDPTIAVVIAHRRKTKTGCNSVESFPLTGNHALHESRRIMPLQCPNCPEKTARTSALPRDQGNENLEK